MSPQHVLLPCARDVVLTGVRGRYAMAEAGGVAPGQVRPKAHTPNRPDSPDGKLSLRPGGTIAIPADEWIRPLGRAVRR